MGGGVGASGLCATGHGGGILWEKKDAAESFSALERLLL